jgi:hypothetical protein
MLCTRPCGLPQCIPPLAQLFTTNLLAARGSAATVFEHLLVGSVHDLVHVDILVDVRKPLIIAREAHVGKHVCTGRGWIRSFTARASE